MLSATLLRKMVTLVVSMTTDPTSSDPASALLSMAAWSPTPSFQVLLFSLFAQLLITFFVSGFLMIVNLGMQSIDVGCEEFHEWMSEIVEARQKYCGER